MKTLKRIADNPFANLVVGLILLATSLNEFWEALHDDIAQMSLGSHHGVIVFSFVHILKTLPDIMESLESVEHSEQTEGKAWRTRSASTGCGR